MAYTKDEIKSFQEKDLRISKLAIVKSLIEKSEDIYDVERVTELAEKYINYVYAERSTSSTKGGQAGCVASGTEQINWELIADGLNLAIPTSQNVKILNQVVDEYKKATKASANPTDILNRCISRFGTYPTKPESVSKVVNNLKG